MTSAFRNPDAVTLSEGELSDYAAFIEELAAAAAEITLPLFRSALEMEDKPGRAYYDPVTNADRNAEAAIRKLINERYPDHSIFGEEYGHEVNASPLTWTIDPIDGTRAFVLGLPLWGTLIALHSGAEPVLGLLGQPYMGERYIGCPGIGLAELRSERGTRKLKTRDPGSLKHASLSATHPSMFKGKMVGAWEELASSVRLQSYGGDCYGYGLVALGTHDLVVEASLSAYDIQALIPIIEAAGGLVTTMDGHPADLGGTAVAAGNAEVHAAALEILKKGL